MVWVLWLLGWAHAQVEVCPSVYDNDLLLADLDEVDAALGGLDLDAARDEMKHVHRMLLCLDSRVDPLGIARFGRQLSLAFFFDQDDAALRRWALLGRTVAPDLPWHADLAQDHPFREAYDGVELPPMAGPDRVLAVDKKAIVYWNGRAITEARAPIEAPALVQVDERGAWRTWWQDGSAFPEELLGDPGPPLELPRGWVQPAGDPVHIERAARALFGEAVADLPDAPAELVADDAEIQAAKKDDDAYRDPFADARRRAIRRLYSETIETNERGDTITRKTEVITFAAVDRSRGEPITYEIFQYWLADHPSWLPEAARAAGEADETYLSDWIDGRPPPNAARRPLIWVPATAAAAYCASFDTSLPRTVDTPATWEWVTTGRQSPKGKVKVEKRRTTGRADTTFRCAESR